MRFWVQSDQAARTMVVNNSLQYKGFKPLTAPIRRSDTSLDGLPAKDLLSNNVRYVEFASPPPRPEIIARIEALKGLAAEEGIAASVASERDMMGLLERLRGAGNPKLFLLDNGNFRATWYADGCVQRRALPL